MLYMLYNRLAIHKQRSIAKTLTVVRYFLCQKKTLGLKMSNSVVKETSDSGKLLLPFAGCNCILKP